jgi:hypothetical protein
LRVRVENCSVSIQFDGVDQRRTVFTLLDSQEPSGFVLLAYPAEFENSVPKSAQLLLLQRDAGTVIACRYRLHDTLLYSFLLSRTFAPLSSLVSFCNARLSRC